MKIDRLSQEVGETEKRDRLEQALVQTFVRAYHVYNELGDEGRVITGETNEFGNVTFKADIELGKTVTASLREQNVSVLLRSEEQEKAIATGDNPQITGILDELDGSNPYKKGIGRHGTMLGFFDGIDPKYNDYLVSGILDYLNARMFIAVKDRGVYVLNIETGEKNPLAKMSELITDNDGLHVRVDGWFEENMEVVAKLLEQGVNDIFVGTPDNDGASCSHYMDLVEGNCNMVIECTRKRNLEPAVAFAFIHELGGVMVDGNGNDFGDKKYLEFGQGENERLNVFSSLSDDLAQRVVKMLL